MTIIAKLSFWIIKPKSKSIITFEDLILDALSQFKTAGYVKKLKTSITPESLPSTKDDLLEFLYNQITQAGYT